MTINAWTPTAVFATGVLTLYSAGAITQGGAIDLSTSGSSLLLRGASAVSLTSGNDFNNIAASIAGALAITNAATHPLTITSITDDVGAVNGIVAPGGVNLQASGSGGSLTINQNIIATNNIVSLSGTGITLAANTTVKSGTANLTLNAGAGTLTLNSGSLVLAGNGTGFIGCD